MTLKPLSILTRPRKAISNLLQASVATMYSCGARVDDVDKGRLQTSTTDQETVDIGLLGKLAAVLLGDTASVQDSGLISSLG